MNSPDTDLIKRVEEKYEAMDRLEQGVVTYLKIALDEMFNTSDVVIPSLQEFFKNFAQDGESKYTSENVALLIHHINIVEERLKILSELPRYTPMCILTGSPIAV